MNWLEKNNKLTLQQLKEGAKEQLQEAIAENWYAHIEDGIYEIADGFIPVYYSDMLEVLYTSNDLDFVDEHNPPSNIKSIYDIIQWNIYNELIAYLYRELDELQEEE